MKLTYDQIDNIFSLQSLIFDISEKILDAIENDIITYDVWRTLEPSKNVRLPNEIILTRYIDNSQIHDHYNIIIDWLNRIDKYTELMIHLNIYDSAMKVYRLMIDVFFIRKQMSEMIAKAVFAPNRVEYIIEKYGYEGLDNL